MSLHRSIESADSLSLSELKLIDQICVESEKAWQEGVEEQVENRLAELDGPLRDRLLSELLAIELHYRRQRGDDPTPQELRQRFPDDAELVLAVLQDDLARDPEALSEAHGTKVAHPRLPERYLPITEIDRGGMGAIWRVTDRHFDRPLAVKIVLPQHVSDGGAVARFEREAKLTGALQHPSVPPVVDRGRLVDGSPFFSMKLIEGETLRSLLKKRSSADTPNGNAGLPRLLTIFEQVCQAVGYAHSLGVIHRDLKPANVMVGGFGEVQVMDWGMAKQLASMTGVDGQVEAGTKCFDESANLPATSETVSYSPSTQDDRQPESPKDVTNTFVDTGDVDEDFTRDGTVMGTLAYMPPEQARGEVQSLDCRSDVFSLGAILCEILTGSSPYTGGREEVLEKAKDGNLREAFERLDSSDADQTLISLAKQCLSKEPADRLADAQALADVMAEFLAEIQERLKNEEMRRVAAEVKATGERRVRRLSVGLALLLISLLLGVGAVVFWRVHEQQARDLQNAIVTKEFDVAIDDFQHYANQQQWPAAAASLERAAGLLTSRANDDMGRKVRQGRADLTAARQLAAVRLEFSEVRFTPLGQQQIDAAYSHAFRQYGFDFDELTPQQLAERIKRSNIQATLQDALEYWGLLRAKASWTKENDKDRVFQVASLATEDPWRRRLLDALIDYNLQQLLQLAEGPIGEQPVSSLLLLAEALALHGQRDQSFRLLNNLHERFPDDFWVNNDFGVHHAIMAQPPDWDEAARYFMAAHALNPQSASVLVNLCNALEKGGKYVEAVKAGQQAVELESDNAMAQANLGNALCSLGKLDEAHEHCLEAVEIDPDLPESNSCLGRVYLMQGKSQRAAVCLRRALERSPDHPFILGNLGAALVLESPSEAIEVLNHAIVAFRKAGVAPNDLAIAYTNLGSAYAEDEQFQASVEAYQEAIRISPGLSDAYYGLGTVYFDQGRWNAAIWSLERAIALNPNSRRAKWNRTLAQAMQALGREAEAAVRRGNRMAKENKFDEAIAEYREALRLKPGHVKAWLGLAFAYQNQEEYDRAVVTYRDALIAVPENSSIWCGLGLCLLKAGRIQEAADCLTQAVDYDPRNGTALTALGFILLESGRFQQAVSRFAAAVQVNAKDVEARAGLGVGYLRLGEVNEAAQALQQAVRLNAQNADIWFHLASASLAQSNVEACISACRKAIKLHDSDGRYHHLLGKALARSGQLVEAADAFKRSVELPHAELEFFTAYAVAQLARGEPTQAISILNDAIERWPTHASARFFLGMTLMNHGRFVEAIANLRIAGELDHSGEHPIEAYIRQCEQLVALEQRVPDVLSGAVQPTADEGIRLARTCRIKGWHVAAVRLYRQSFAQDSTLACRMDTKARFYAASSAAFAGCGQSKEESRPDEETSLQFRRDAREWLHDDLAYWKQVLEDGDEKTALLVAQKLNYWRISPYLSCVREDSSLVRLPSDEQEKWQRLWNEVEQLISAANNKAATPN